MITLSSKDIKELCSSFSVDEHDAFVLLQHVLGTPYSSLVLSKEIKISKEQLFAFKSKLKMRFDHVPVAKIVGHKAFYNHDFITNEYTLDPRPETELIVDLVVKYFPNKTDTLSILDLGCGTGCIGLSILDLYPNAKLLLADISTEALTVTEKNAIRLKIDKRCNYIKSNWFSNINTKFNIIVCNPPYIAENYNLDFDTLHDPKIALFGGKDGLDAYRKILPNINKFLVPNGLLFLEIGINQCDNICAIESRLKVVEIAKDLQGIERTIVFKVKN